MRTPYFPFIGPYVYFDGPAYSLSSLGNVVFHLVRELRRKGVPAFSKILPAGTFYPDFTEARHLSRTSPQVQRTAVDDFIYINPGWDYEEHLAIYARQSISIVAIDDFRAYSRRRAAKRYNRIASFSKFSAEALKDILKTDVDYFPLGIDTCSFYPLNPWESKPPPLKFHYRNFQFPVSSFEGYVFLNVNFHQRRKGTAELLTAYHNAFIGNPNVMLLIHGPQCHWADGRETEKLSMFNHPHSPLVAWSTNLLSTSQINQLFNFSDCYVSPHHLEGFGFGPLQALACDKAVISSAAMGPMDYLTHNNSELIPCKISQLQIENFGKFPWATYSLDDLIDLMRTLPKVKSGARATALKWDWDRSAFEFKRLLDAPGRIDTDIVPNYCTVVILCKDSPSLLRSCLESMLKYPGMYSQSILVVNDGNSTAVSNILRDYLQLSIEELVIPNSQGIAHARNQALARIHTEYTLFLDCDTKVMESHWLSMWIKAHKESKAAASTVLQVHPDGRINFDNAMTPGQRPTFNLPITTASSAAMKVPYCQGSALLVNTDLAQRYGFCEDYTYYYDDVDFCSTLIKNGYSCWYLPVTRIFHNPRELRATTIHMTAKDIGQTTHDSYWNQGIVPAV